MKTVRPPKVYDNAALRRGFQKIAPPDGPLVEDCFVIGFAPELGGYRTLVVYRADGSTDLMPLEMVFAGPLLDDITKQGSSSD